MAWIDAVIWCVNVLGCYPDFSGEAQTFRCIPLVETLRRD